MPLDSNTPSPSELRGLTLPELPVGSKAGYRNHTTNQFNIGIISARNSRSYTICTENGTNISRNHIDLKRTDTPFESQPHSQPVMSNFAKSQHAPSLTTVPSSTSTNANIKDNNKAKLIGKRIEANSRIIINLACTLHAVVTCQNQLQD